MPCYMGTEQCTFLPWIWPTGNINVSLALNFLKWFVKDLFLSPPPFFFSREKLYRSCIKKIKILASLHCCICILIYAECVSRLTAGKGKMQEAAVLSQGLWVWNESRALERPNTLFSGCQSPNIDFPFSSRNAALHTPRFGGRTRNTGSCSCCLKYNQGCSRCPSGGCRKGCI